MVTRLCTLLLGYGTLVAGRCYDDGGTFRAATWPQCQEAAPNINLYSGASSDGRYVKLGVHIYNHSKGWSAIGFSGNGGMKGASEIVVRLVEDQWVAEDRYSLDYVTPSLDPEQNVQLIFAQDNGQNTSWAVVVPRDSCDINDYAAYNVSRTFIWALGPSHEFVKHYARGQFHANLFSGIQPLAPLNNVSNVDIKMDNVTVVSATSDAENPYICGIFDLRQLLPNRNLTEKVHIAKFSPFLDNATGSYVHHMILYGCDQSQANNFTHKEVIADCQSMPPGCTAFKWVWAVGSTDVQLPNNVGMPIGQGNYWVALQMHYYNPNGANVGDSSGVTLSITPDIRPIDAGIMQLNGGTSPQLRADLPAATSNFSLTPSLIVPSICTNSWQGPLTVVGAAHHMHLLGIHQQIEVSRNGTNLGVMRPERIFDFNHQSLEEPLIHQLLPGDEIQLKCVYDTSRKNTTTQFGENTDNEMCWSALMYYPAQTFSDAIILPVEPVEVRNASAQVCLSPSQAYQNVSACAEVYLNTPLILGGLNMRRIQSNPQLQNASASVLCNTLPRASPQDFASLLRLWPNVCPPCYNASNCTVEELVSHGQTSVCPMICNVTHQVSVYPDVSRQVNNTYDQRTYCGAQPGVAYYFKNAFPALPPCVAQGNASSTDSAKNQLVSGVLTDQNACPNADIKEVLTRCAPQDIDLVGTNQTNNCRPPCQNATSRLASAFQAMNPAPSADQKVKCLADYNRTWAPANAANQSWSQWAVLENRLRNGAAICGDGSTRQYSSASQLMPFTMMFAIVMFVTAK